MSPFSPRAPLLLSQAKHIICHLTIQGHTSKVRCFAVDLVLPYNVVLGDPRLDQEHAVLTHGRAEVTVGSVASRR